jgi:hypothetical protein
VHALKLICVTEGHFDDQYWIGIDGDEASLNSEALIAAHLDHLRPACRDGSVCIVESDDETRLFTRDLTLHKQLLERFKADLTKR